MSILLVLYCLDVMLLVIHEIESAFEKEWEILRLPGGISGFLLLHVPLVLVLLYGTVEVARATAVGMALSLIIGAAGTLPLLVHQVIAKRKDRFNRLLSQVILWLNAATGIGLVVAAIL